MTGELIVGIDPGQETGFAVYDPSAGSLLRCESNTFWEVVQVLRGVFFHPTSRGGPVGLVVVEDARNLPIYARQDAVRGRRRDALCRAVGRIDRDTELWEVWLRARGYDVLLVEPTKAEKWDAGIFRRVTGFGGRTNEHARDAARLIWGRTVPRTLFDREQARVGT